VVGCGKDFTELFGGVSDDSIILPSYGSLYVLGSKLGMVINLGAQVYIPTIRIPYWSWEDHPQYKGVQTLENKYGNQICLLAFASGRSVLTTWRQSGYSVDLRVLNSPHLKLFHIPSPIALCHTNAPFSADRCQPFPCIPMMPTLMPLAKTHLGVWYSKIYDPKDW